MPKPRKITSLKSKPCFGYCGALRWEITGWWRPLPRTATRPDPAHPKALGLPPAQPAPVPAPMPTDAAGIPYNDPRAAI